MSSKLTFHLIEVPSDYHLTAQNHAPVTFGAEFEFSLASSLRKWTTKPPFSKSIPALEDAQEDIRDVINSEFGESIALANDDREDDMLDSRDELRYWMVDKDNTVRPPRDGRHYLPMEIQTPALFYERYGVNEIQRVLATLTETYGERIQTSNTSSVHVHVGFGHEGFELYELKHLLAIWWVFEAQFYSLGPRHRHENKYCRLVRYSTVIGQLVKDNTNAEIENKSLKGLNMILCATSKQELFQFWNIVATEKAEKVGLKIDCLKFPGSERTVEFRIHEGCLDPEEVKHWIDFCCGVVVFAASVRTPSLGSWLETIAADEDLAQNYPVGEVLKAMKLDGCAEHFDRKINRMTLDPNTDSEGQPGNDIVGDSISQQATPEGSTDEDTDGGDPSIGGRINQLDWGKLMETPRDRSLLRVQPAENRMTDCIVALGNQ